MEWKIYDVNDEFLMEANCQYDCCDLSVMFYNATIIEINFEKQEARILEKKE